MAEQREWHVTAQVRVRVTADMDTDARWAVLKAIELAALGQQGAQGASKVSVAGMNILDCVETAN